MPKFGSVNTSVLAQQMISGYWAWSEYGGTQPRFWMNSNSGHPTEITVNISELQADHQALAIQALNVWQDVANIHFNYTNSAADITYVDFTKADGSAKGDTAQTTFFDALTNRLELTTATVDLSRNFGFGPTSSTWNDFFQAMVHETGHALGLGHTGNYNDGLINSYYNTNSTLYANDTQKWSVMSYNDQAQYGDASADNVMTPQMADIFAIQAIYGAATTRTGDSVYGFNSNVGEFYDFAHYQTRRRFNLAPSFTIYDSGGNDTLDTSGFSASQTIDLRAGNWSSIGSYKDNVAIYKGVIIENAVGGRGADTIYGNDVANLLNGGAGNDTLSGGLGNDVLVGGLGNDTYVIDSLGDSIVELPGAENGTDEIATTMSIYTLGANIENVSYIQPTGGPQAFVGNGNELNNRISGGGLADRLSGNDGDDLLIGNDGADKLFGNLGNDTLRGGAGDDLLNGRDGSDTADYSDVKVRTEIDLEKGTATVFRPGATESDTLVSIENVIAGLGDDKVTGSSEDNTFAYSGQFTRSAQTGGLDQYDGGDGSDTVDFSHFVGNVQVDLRDQNAAASYNIRMHGPASMVTGLLANFSSIENVVASNGNDVVTGNGADNIITYVGSYTAASNTGGTDTYSGGGGHDTIDFSKFTGGVYVDFADGTASSSYTVTTSGDVTVNTRLLANFSGIENAVSTLADDTVTGDAKDNTLTYVGSYTIDRDTGGLDNFDGGDGVDTVDFSDFVGHIWVDLQGNLASASYSYQTQNGGGASARLVTRLTNVENAVGGSIEDNFEGNAADNQFTGGGGSDTFIFSGPGFGHDIITDFAVSSAGAVAHDILQIRTSVFADWEQLLAATADSKGGAVITLDDSNSITLSGVTKAQLEDNFETDFSFY